MVIPSETITIASWAELTSGTFIHYEAQECGFESEMNTKAAQLGVIKVCTKALYRNWDCDHHYDHHIIT